MSNPNPNSPVETIKAYQRTLQAAGLYLQAIDGQWGPGTQRAHLAYEAIKNPPAPGGGGIAQIADKIVARARHFVGLTEIVSNARWDDVLTSGRDPEAEELRAALISVGWQPGWAYCAAASEVFWRAGYEGRPELPLITRAMTPSVMETHDNFKKMGRVTRTPHVGALMLMQHGSAYQGHMGVVIDVDGNTFHTIEANTSPGKGGTVEQQRNGDGVYEKRHQLAFGSGGLHLIGFVNPFII